MPEITSSEAVFCVLFLAYMVGVGAVATVLGQVIKELSKEGGVESDALGLIAGAVATLGAVISATWPVSIPVVSLLLRARDKDDDDKKGGKRGRLKHRLKEGALRLRKALAGNT